MARNSSVSVSFPDWAVRLGSAARWRASKPVSVALAISNRGIGVGWGGGGGSAKAGPAGRPGEARTLAAAVTRTVVAGLAAIRPGWAEDAGSRGSFTFGGRGRECRRSAVPGCAVAAASAGVVGSATGAPGSALSGVAGFGGFSAGLAGVGEPGGGLAASTGFGAGLAGLAGFGFGLVAFGAGLAGFGFGLVAVGAGLAGFGESGRGLAASTGFGAGLAGLADFGFGPVAVGAGLTGVGAGSTGFGAGLAGFAESSFGLSGGLGTSALGMSPLVLAGATAPGCCPATVPSPSDGTGVWANALGAPAAAAANSSAETAPNPLDDTYHPQSRTVPMPTRATLLGNRPFRAPDRDEPPNVAPQASGTGDR
jgi:hypothetical protein